MSTTDTTTYAQAAETVHNINHNCITQIQSYPEKRREKRKRPSFDHSARFSPDNNANHATLKCMNTNISAAQKNRSATCFGCGTDLDDLSSEGLLAQLEEQLVMPDLSAKQLGTIGEQYAAAWLAQLGWHVLARNWSTRFGELDIIMMAPEHIVVFVEVKTRRTQRYGTPQEAITPHKQANLHHAASLWLAGPGKSIRRSGIRFDAMSILLQGNRPRVQHIPGAF
ncbi:YraN family protein [Bifidobacterium sp. ESL0764]|uniref:YraN family protein n=1 Tax=Bifidobacterium sp. ESL0764 TaxID=2983228 RepID=UPI0023F88C05|nr:YraN family protein [Bifidobacterium sp. ESL0764]WEV65270.1 YraN family protein [Bifidobacterium sp. ESL0764]